jgi:hypothetical protein
MSHSNQNRIKLYSSEPEVKKDVVYQILFDRNAELLGELKKAATFEEDEKIAVLMTQVALVLESFPRDMAMEKRILAALQFNRGVVELSQEQWKYLEYNAPSKMVIAILSAMSGVPIAAQGFVEVSLSSLDPMVRIFAARIGIISGRPTHFVQVLKLIQDKDPRVVMAAYKAITSIKSTDMGLMLDSAFASADPWLLESLAPFLPLLVTEELRWLLGKLQYHPHEMVVSNAKLALNKLNDKIFDGVREKRIKEEEARKAEELANSPEARLERELSNISMDEMQEFRETLKLYNDEWKDAAQERAIAEKLDIFFPENMDSDFTKERELLANAVNEELENELIAEAEGFRREKEDALLRQKDELAQERDQLAELLRETGERLGALEASIEDDYRFEMLEAVVRDEVAGGVVEIFVDEVARTELREVVWNEVKDEVRDEVLEEVRTELQAEVREAVRGEVREEVRWEVREEVRDELKKELLAEVEREEVVKRELELAQEQELKKELELAQEAVLGVAQRPVQSAQRPVQQPTQKPSAANVKEVKRPVQPAATAKPAVSAAKSLLLPNDARIIIETYPSFIGDSLLRVFKAKEDEAKLAELRRALRELVSFLNLCFIQSCIYFAQESKGLEENIKQCLKHELAGPAYLRNLHNFVVALKPAHGSSGFFTFTLAGILSESSASNPLMLMRELDQFLKNPEEPLGDNVEMAVEGLLEILKGVRCIKNNPIVMRTPVGVKVPYADLSGPFAVPMEQQKQPLLDLPHGEIVVLSRERTEALGLYPIIKYNKRKTYYSNPSTVEFLQLYERLEVTLD